MEGEEANGRVMEQPDKEYKQHEVLHILFPCSASAFFLHLIIDKFIVYVCIYSLPFYSHELICVQGKLILLSRIHG